MNDNTEALPPLRDVLVGILAILDGGYTITSASREHKLLRAALAQRQQVPEHCPACGYELAVTERAATPTTDQGEMT